MRRKRMPARAGLIAAVALMATGCGSQTDRLKISGEVSLDGIPLDKGSIRFTSVGETPQAAGAMIQQGRYLIPAENGLLPGEYAVVIRSPDNDAPKVLVQGFPTAPDRVPVEYNAETKLRVQVERSGENYFAFEVPGVGG